MALHLSGVSVREISRHLKNGASPATVYRIIKLETNKSGSHEGKNNGT
jgi:IS30 family transposase